MFPLSLLLCCCLHYLRHLRGLSSLSTLVLRFVHSPPGLQAKKANGEPLRYGDVSRAEWMAAINSAKQAASKTEASEIAARNLDRAGKLLVELAIDPELRHQPLQLITEIQLYLRYYLEMRKETHLYFSKSDNLVGLSRCRGGWGHAYALPTLSPAIARADAIEQPQDAQEGLRGLRANPYRPRRRSGCRCDRTGSPARAGAS